MLLIVYCCLPGRKYRLLCGHDYKVGRVDADILVQTDKSISREHAFLKVEHLEGNVVSFIRCTENQILVFWFMCRFAVLYADKTGGL